MSQAAYVRQALSEKLERDGFETVSDVERRANDVDGPQPADALRREEAR
jgi:hypothetical protein